MLHGGRVVRIPSQQCQPRTQSTVGRVNCDESESGMYESENVFLGMVGTDSKKGWMTDLEVNGRMITFKIDTGADVTVVPRSL